MTRQPLILNYTFPGTTGTAVAAANSGNDWVDQNPAYSAQLRVNQAGNTFNNPFSSFADCCWKGANAASFTANQYSSVTLSGITHGGDQMGVVVLSNGGTVSGTPTDSMYRCFYLDDSIGGNGFVYLERIINNNVSATLANVSGVLANGTKLSCEVTITANVPTFNVYTDTGSGPVLYGGPYTDNSASKLVSGNVGITAASSALTMLGGPWEGGILTSGIVYKPFRLYSNGAFQANVFAQSLTGLPAGVIMRLYGSNNTVQIANVVQSGAGKIKLLANGQLICNNTIIV